MRARPVIERRRKQQHRLGGTRHADLDALQLIKNQLREQFGVDASERLPLSLFHYCLRHVAQSPLQTLSPPCEYFQEALLLYRDWQTLLKRNRLVFQKRYDLEMAQQFVSRQGLLPVRSTRQVDHLVACISPNAPPADLDFARTWRRLRRNTNAK